jgi:endonuclease/exonuclease/phosphatase family metal-dependent hydrolase
VSITVRVMTWNVWWRFGDWERRRFAIREVLRAERPDVVGLQEVWDDGDANLAAWLADDLGLHWAFGAGSDQRPWRERVADPTLRNGVAVLSRWPIADPTTYDLPEDPSRAALAVRVEAPHAAVPFVTTHLSVLPGSTRRVVQVEWLARLVATLPADEHPPVLVGDLNAEPDSDEIRRLGGHLTAPVVEGQVLIDAWRYADPRDPGHTWDRANAYVAQWMAPGGRIDYIHVVARGEPPGHVRSVRRAATGPVDGVWASDHAAVVAELSDERQPERR